MWAEISSLTLMGMDAAWVSVWYQYIQNGRITWWSALAALFAAELFSHLLARFFNFFRIKKRIRIGLFLAWLVALQLLTLNALVYQWQPRSTLFTGLTLAEALHGLIFTLLVLRGVLLATSALDSWSAQGSFRAGILLLGLYYLLTPPQETGHTLLPITAFLLLALLSLSATRIADLSISRGGRVPPFRWRGWLGIAGTAVLSVGLGVLTGQLFGWTIGKLLAGVFLGLLAIILLAGLILSAPLLALLNFIISRIRPGFNLKAFQAMQQSFQQSASNVLEMLDKAAKEIINWEEAARLWLIAIALAITLYFIIRQLNAARIKRAEAADDIRSDLGRAEKAPRRPADGPAQRRSAAQILAAAQVRRAYAQLMQLCRALEQPRPPAATPLEFLPVLEQLFPEQREQVTLMTRLYTRIRYGEYPEDAVEVSQVLAGWRQVQAAGRKKLAELRREKINLKRIALRQ